MLLGWIYLLLQYLDVITTLYGLTLPGTYEMNPLAYWALTAHPWLFIGIKLVPAAIALWCWHLLTPTIKLALKIMCWLLALAVINNCVIIFLAGKI